MSQRQRSVRREFDDSESEKSTDKPMLVVSGGKVRNPKLSLSEQIAGTPYYIRNWKWSGAVEDFPNEPWLRCVDKFYPKAQMCPLALDEPTYEQDMVACERKARVLRKRNIRYLILKPNMTLEEALVQLAQDEAEVA